MGHCVRQPIFLVCSVRWVWSSSAQRHRQAWSKMGEKRMVHEERSFMWKHEGKTFRRKLKRVGFSSGWSVAKFSIMHFTADAWLMFWSVCCSWSSFWATSRRRIVSALCVFPTASRLVSCFMLTSSGWCWMRKRLEQVHIISFTITDYRSLFPWPLMSVEIRTG